MRVAELAARHAEKEPPPDLAPIRKPAQVNTQWMWAAVSALPLVLLALRLWLLSRGDVQVMLLLMQNVSPIGLITGLVIGLIWIVPAVVLAVWVLSTLLLVSDPESSSRLARESDRLPGWVFWLAVGLAALTWQVRFLPTLLAAVLITVALNARRRFPRHSVNWLFRGRALPVAAALLGYAWLMPGVASAFSLGEVVNGLLLLIPPGAAVVLTGPVPRRAARVVIRSAALTAGVLAPVLFAVMFSRAPILPSVAIELEGAKPCQQFGDVSSPRSTCVLLGQIITVDDRMATVLRRDGGVVFVPNGVQRSKVLCRTDEEVPSSRVDIRGWHIEHRMLVLIQPPAPRIEPDSRCQGRPLPEDDPGSREPEPVAD